MKSKLFYFDDEISVIYVCLVNLLGVKVVLIIGSTFWVWGGGEGSDGVILLWAL
jgi:hypothetical protein